VFVFIPPFFLFFLVIDWVTGIVRFIFFISTLFYLCYSFFPVLIFSFISFVRSYLLFFLASIRGFLYPFFFFLFLVRLSFVYLFVRFFRYLLPFIGSSYFMLWFFIFPFLYFLIRLRFEVIKVFLNFLLFPLPIFSFLCASVDKFFLALLFFSFVLYRLSSVCTGCSLLFSELILVASSVVRSDRSSRYPP